MPLAYVVSDLNGEEVVETFYEKELQNTNQKEFRVEKVRISKVKSWKSKVIIYMLNGKAKLIYLTVRW